MFQNLMFKVITSIMTNKSHKKNMYIPKLFKSLMLSKFTAAPISPNNKGWNNIHIMPTTSAMVS